MLIISQDRAPTTIMKMSINPKCVVLVISHLGSRRAFGPSTHKACMIWIGRVRFILEGI